MSSIADIERAVEQLSPEDLQEFRAWFAERDARDWDRQFETDVAAGELNELADEAIQDLRHDRCTDL